MKNNSPIYCMIYSVIAFTIMSNEGVTSWYDFASAIMEISNIDCKVIPIETKDYPTQARRPLYSVLDKSKIKSDFKAIIPHWRDSLANCIKKINHNS